MPRDEITLDEVDQTYWPMIKNIDTKNPRLMVLFSSPAGTGKSTTAKEIEEQFHGLRLQNDAIRKIIQKTNPSLTLAERSKITHNYMEYLWEELVSTSPNGLWIIDASIDRRYETLATFAEKYKFQI